MAGWVGGREASGGGGDGGGVGRGSCVVSLMSNIHTDAAKLDVHRVEQPGEVDNPLLGLSLKRRGNGYHLWEYRSEVIFFFKYIPADVMICMCDGNLSNDLLFLHVTHTIILLSLPYINLGI